MSDHDAAELAQTLFEEIGDAAFIVDPATLRLVEVNPMAQRMTRLGREALLKLMLEQLLKSETEGGLAHIQRALHTTQTFHSQEGYYLHCADKTGWIPVNLTLTRLHSERGQLGLVLARDVSERIKAAENLRVANASLERRVEERTSELARMNQSLREEIVRCQEEAKARRDTEERFRGAFEHTAVAMVLTDVNNRFVRVNAAFARLFGYSVAEMVGITMAEVTHPDWLEESLSRREDLLSGRAHYFQMEKQYRHKLGHAFWGLTNVSLVRDPRGRPLLYVGQVQDITERKRAEERLAAQHAVVSILADSSSLAEAAPRLLRAVCESTEWEAGTLWKLQPSSNSLECVDHWHIERDGMAEFEAATRQRRFERGVGLPGRVWESGQAAWIVDVTKDSNFPRREAAAQAGLRGGFGFPIKFAERVFGVAEFLSSASREPDDELLRVFNALGIQIGQFIERQRIQERLRLFRALIDQTNDMIEVIDPATGRFLDVNERACWAHGYSREEFLRLGVADVDPFVAAMSWESAVRERLLTETPVFESEHRRKDGSVFPVEINVNSIRVDRDYLVAVVRDITDRKLLESQYLQSQKMEAIGRLAGGVAHDFNNLLTIINGYGELILDGLVAADPMRDQVRQIVDAGRRASKLTAQLLTMSRKAIIKPKLLSPAGVVSNLERMLRRVVGEDIQLAVASDSEEGIVRADAGQLEQVILNLVVNARDAMPKGGRLTIEVRNVDLDESYCKTHMEARPGPHVLIAVTDSGCGMDSATITQVFEPFFTTKGEFGTGLGLATVHGIVKQSGGHVGVYSEVGRGTTFKVYLPREQEVGSSRQQAPPERAAMPRGRETILVVEDEAGVRALASFVLKKCGYSVIEAADGTEAVTRAAESTQRIDALLTDVVLPGMGGREIAERLLTLHPEMKVLYMSGYTDDAVVRHGILESQVAFIQKPFKPDALATKLREVLDAR